MDRIILSDGTSYEIADGASLGRIQIKANGYDAIKPIIDTFNSENLKSVQFKRNDSVLGHTRILLVMVFHSKRTERQQLR